MSLARVIGQILASFPGSRGVKGAPGLQCVRMRINFQEVVEFRLTNGHFRLTYKSRASVKGTGSLRQERCW